MPTTQFAPLALAIPSPLLRSNTMESLCSTSSTFSDTSTRASTPDPDQTATAYAIQKLIPSSTQPCSTTISLFASLEEANNTVYKMRLEYETCDPCFFWYGDGHGSSSSSSSIPPSTSTSASISATNRDFEIETTQDVERNEKGDCLSWEVFADGEEEAGCRVWVERVQVAVGSPVEELGKGESWREALEPIARPCEFWGRVVVKGTYVKGEK